MPCCTPVANCRMYWYDSLSRVSCLQRLSWALFGHWIPPTMLRNLIVTSPMAVEPNTAPGTSTMENAVVLHRQKPPIDHASEPASHRPPPWFVAPPELAPPTDVPCLLLTPIRHAHFSRRWLHNTHFFSRRCVVRHRQHR